MIKEVELKKKTKLILEMNELSSTIQEYKKRINIIKEKITKLEKSESKFRLNVSDHAIQRFKERINPNYSREQIITKLVTRSLIDDYQRCNCEGKKIIHPDIPNCVCIIRKNIILTVIPDKREFNPYSELAKLDIYMKYFINRLCGEEVPLTFIEWKDMNTEALKRIKNKAN